jgi:uncharacterized repeat protein (TIGR04052 family)
MLLGLALLASGASLGACSGDKTYSVEFDALVGGQPFSCTQSYDGIGSSKATIQPLDLRMYVSGFELVKKSGDTVPLALVPDGTWQDSEVAYLDFEDATGTCAGGTPQVNTKVVGRAPDGDYTAIRFNLGVPSDEDHLNIGSAKPPLTDPNMFWAWSVGYRYLKVEVQTAVQQFFFHLGAEDCTGTNPSFDCLYPNVATVPLTGFSMGASHVSLDLANLFATSDLDAPAMPAEDTPGCQSDDSEPACGPLFNALGLTFLSTAPGPAQTFFGVAQ